MAWQLAVVGTLLALAAGYLVRRALAARGKECGGGCGCDAAEAGSSPLRDRLGRRVPIVELEMSARATTGSTSRRVNPGGDSPRPSAQDAPCDPEAGEC